MKYNTLGDSSRNIEFIIATIIIGIAACGFTSFVCGTSRVYFETFTSQ
jgi:hypothetical protein